MNQWELRVKTAVTVLSVVLLPNMPMAEIGSQGPEDGPFLLDDVEDIDRVADGVMRNWIWTYVPPEQGGFQPISLSGTDLILADDQSPAGAFEFVIPSSFGFIEGNFGVPMPAVDGASTLSDPGNISGFLTLDFLSRYESDVVDLEFWVILETYPEVSQNTFPRLMWKYTPAKGQAFQQAAVNLHSPTLILDGDGFAVAELLDQTRFISFYYFGQTGNLLPKQLEVHVDDIRLVPKNLSSGSGHVGWMFYGEPPDVSKMTSDANEDEDDNLKKETRW